MTEHSPAELKPEESFDFDGKDYVLADCLNRALALWVDLLLIGFIWIPVVLIYVSGPIPEGLAISLDQAQLAKQPWYLALSSVLIWAFISVCYFFFLEGGGNQATIGKSLLRLRISTEKGEMVSMPRVLLRQLGKLLSFFSFMLGFLIAIFSPKKQTFHDRLAQTLVLQEPQVSLRVVRIVLSSAVVVTVALVTFLSEFSARSALLSYLSGESSKTSLARHIVKAPPTPEPTQPTELSTATDGTGYLLIGDERFEFKESIALWDDFNRTAYVYFFVRQLTEDERNQFRQFQVTKKPPVEPSIKHQLLLLLQVSSGSQLSKESLRGYSVIIEDPNGKAVTFGMRYSPSSSDVFNLDGRLGSEGEISGNFRGGKFWPPTSKNYVWNVRFKTATSLLLREKY